MSTIFLRNNPLYTTILHKLTTDADMKFQKYSIFVQFVQYLDKILLRKEHFIFFPKVEVLKALLLH